MRRIQKLIVGFAFLLTAVPAAAQTAVGFDVAAPELTASSSDPAVQAAPNVPAPLTVMTAVKKGRELLKADKAARAPKLAAMKPIPGGPNSAEIAVAVWDKNTDSVSLVYAVKAGTDLKVTTPGDWPLRVTSDAKAASRYGFPEARNAVVVGVRYPVAIVGGTKKKRTYTLRDTVYVPTDRSFYNPSVLSAGSDYLSYLIQDAFVELRAMGIKSRAYPDRLLVDVIDPYLLKSIVVIEHSGHAVLLSDDEPESVLGAFLVKLALNEGDAFDTTTSTAGAAGLVQFIPSTYKLYVTRRPELELIPDFRTGMADHKNAVKAEVAYLDTSLAEMPRAIRDVYAGDKTKAAEFLAAAYNGGDSRVRRAYASFGERWAENLLLEVPKLNVRAAALKKEIAALDKQIAKGVKGSRAQKEAKVAERNKVLGMTYAINANALRKETAIYVAKLRKTYSLLAAGAFATPAAPSGALPVVAQGAAPVALALAGGTTAPSLPQ